MRRRMTLTAGLAVAVLSFGAAQSAHAAAFGIFEQGSKAMGMAGAFTAQANDPSAIFHNAGGVAFLDTQFSTGATWIAVNGSRFNGAAPFPGPNATGQMEDLNAFPPHLYYVRKVNDTWRLGLGVLSPFGLQTEWQDKNNFSGRYVSLFGSLKVIDVNPMAAVQVTPNLGIGFGIVGRFSSVELERRVPSVNPFTGLVTDIANIKLESDTDNGTGWNAGLLYKANDNVSFGLSYRSKVKVDYSGDARFTQISTGIPQLDAIVAGQLPFGAKQPVSTAIEFPDQASFGVALRLTHRLLMEVDANWTGWSSFDELPLTFDTQPQLSSVIPENYDDAYNYRIGFQLTTRTAASLRFGFVYDETPVPDESVGPLLPDNKRRGFTVGWGTPSGKLDLALMYLDSGSRTTTTNRDGFNGTYETDAFLFGVTYNW